MSFIFYVASLCVLNNLNGGFDDLPKNVYCALFYKKKRKRYAYCEEQACVSVIATAVGLDTYVHAFYDLNHFHVFRDFHSFSYSVFDEGVCLTFS